MEFADWTRAYVMMGDSPAGIREVLLAADGSMYALLQGEDALGALHTVRLDDEGRMSAFVIDSTDAWGRMLSIGNAELAARLGSIVSYERSGQVVLAEGFEHGLQRWLVELSTGGAEVVIDPEYCLSGGYSCRMTAGTTGSQNARITYKQGLLPKGKVGLSFAISCSGEFDTFEFIVFLYDGVNEYYMAGKLDDHSNDLLIYDDTPGWRDVGDADPSSGAKYDFNYVKVVADLENRAYDSLKFNDRVISLSTYGLRETAVGTPAGIDIYFTLTGDALANDVVNIDNVVFTVAEP